MDDIIVVTKGSKQKHKDELIDVLSKLKNAGYRLSERKSKLFKTEIEKIGQKNIKTELDLYKTSYSQSKN